MLVICARRITVPGTPFDEINRLEPPPRICQGSELDLRLSSKDASSSALAGTHRRSASPPIFKVVKRASCALAISSPAQSRRHQPQDLRTNLSYITGADCQNQITWLEE